MHTFGRQARDACFGVQALLACNLTDEIGFVDQDVQI